MLLLRPIQQQQPRFFITEDRNDCESSRPPGEPLPSRIGAGCCILTRKAECGPSHFRDGSLFNMEASQEPGMKAFEISTVKRLHEKLVAADSTMYSYYPGEGAAVAIALFKNYFAKW